MELTTQQKGITTEMYVAAYLLSLGYNVSQPLCQDSKYDLIVDVNNHLLRLQVKTARQEKEGSIIRITDEETRSFVITEKSEGRRKKKNSVRQIKVYYSPISASTLQKRADLLIRSFSHTSSTNKEQNINI